MFKLVDHGEQNMDKIEELKQLFRNYTKYVKPTSPDNRVLAHNTEAEIYAKINWIHAELGQKDMCMSLMDNEPI